MLLFLKKVLKYITIYWKQFLIITGIVGVVILFLLLKKKNDKILQLKDELYYLKAKVELEKLAIKNDMLLKDLNNLEKLDDNITSEIKKIEEDLNNSTSENLTAEEIVRRFKNL